MWIYKLVHKFTTLIVIQLTNWLNESLIYEATVKLEFPSGNLNLRFKKRLKFL